MTKELGGDPLELKARDGLPLQFLSLINNYH
nr:MAG TPA: hypothetical protein [Caudoviricetes sp.]